MAGLALLTLFLIFTPPILATDDLRSSTKIPPVTDFPQSKVRIIRGGPFRLIDHLGKQVTNKDFDDKYLLIYFGYTYCPDVCPMDLSVMASAYKLLGSHSKKIQMLFITFDPKRDTRERVADYVAHFHPKLIGLTGTEAQTLAAANYFGVDVSATYKAGSPGSAYSMNHSAFTYLVAPKGKLTTLFRDGTSAQLMAKTLTKHIN